MRILDGLGSPISAKFDGGKAHRLAVDAENGHCLFSIVGEGGLFYANTVGAFGAVSAVRNWGRLAIAVRRCALKLAENNDFALYYSRATP